MRSLFGVGHIGGAGHEVFGNGHAQRLAGVGVDVEGAFFDGLVGDVGGFRLPLCEMEDTNREKLRQTMKDVGLL